MTGGRSRRRRIASVLTTLVASTVGLTGCTGGGDSLNGEQTKSAAQVLADAAQALRSAPGVRVVGQGRVMGRTILIDFRVHGEDAIGRIDGSDGVALDVLRVHGTEYDRGGAGVDPEVAARVNGRWVEQPSNMTLDSLMTPDGLANSLFGSFKVDGKVTRSQRDGRDVLVLTGSDLSGRGTIEVALHGPPLPVHTTSEGSEPGFEDITEYDNAVTVLAPTNYISAAQYRDLVARFGDSPENHVRWPINN